MARVKGAMMTRKRRNATLKLAKGYWGSKSKHFKMAKQAVMKSGNYAFEGRKQKKREKEAKKNQRVVEIKEIRMSPSIDTNDLNTKVKAAQKFLTDGNRVKVSVRFRGREMAHTNLGEKLLMDFAAACSEVASMEKNPKLEGRFMAMFLTPKNSK